MRRSDWRVLIPLVGAAMVVGFGIAVVTVNGPPPQKTAAVSPAISCPCPCGCAETGVCVCGDGSFGDACSCECGCHFSHLCTCVVKTSAGWEVYFSPEGGCTEAVVREIGKAKNEVLVQAYSFTSKPIFDALVAAHRRDVNVKAIFDKSDATGKESLAKTLAGTGIPCWLDQRHAIAHNKVMIVDQSTVITGSFNFTTAAEKHNAENLLILRDPKLAAKYTDAWRVHKGHSEAWKP